LLANFVHQVINPLNGVIGTIDNVIDGTVSGARVEQRLRAARAQLQQSVQLVRNLAFFSELSVGSGASTSRTRKTCVIPQIIIEAAQFFQELGSSKNMKIHLEDRETQYKVEGNPDLLRQVFMNLFDNAVKYGQPGTEVRVVPTVQKKTNSLLIRVSGHSISIPSEERESIFSLGYRSGSARDRVASGTGLGLYICRMILNRVHSASIEVETSRSTGETTFLLRFPKYSV
jgi:signal transduction histidine kinase